MFATAVEVVDDASSGGHFTLSLGGDSVALVASTAAVFGLCLAVEDDAVGDQGHAGS